MPSPESPAKRTVAPGKVSMGRDCGSAFPVVLVTIMLQDSSVNESEEMKSERRGGSRNSSTAEQDPYFAENKTHPIFSACIDGLKWFPLFRENRAIRP